MPKKVEYSEDIKIVFAENYDNPEDLGVKVSVNCQEYYDGTVSGFCEYFDKASDLEVALFYFLKRCNEDNSYVDVVFEVDSSTFDEEDVQTIQTVVRNIRKVCEETLELKGISYNIINTKEDDPTNM